MFKKPVTSHVTISPIPTTACCAACAEGSSAGSTWMEDRIHPLASRYAIAVLAFAVMSNHVHMMVATDRGRSHSTRLFGSPLICLSHYPELIAWSNKIAVLDPASTMVAIKTCTSSCRASLNCRSSPWVRQLAPTRSGLCRQQYHRHAAQRAVRYPVDRRFRRSLNRSRP